MSPTLILRCNYITMRVTVMPLNDNICLVNTRKCVICQNNYCPLIEATHNLRCYFHIFHSENKTLHLKLGVQSCAAFKTLEKSPCEDECTLLVYYSETIFAIFSSQNGWRFLPYHNFKEIIASLGENYVLTVRLIFK